MRHTAQQLYSLQTYFLLIGGLFVVFALYAHGHNNILK